MLRTYLLTVVLPIAAALLSACEKIRVEEPPVACTVLAYLAGDNNLSAEVAQKAEAMRQGAAAANVGTLLVYWDKPQGASLQRLAADGSFETIETYGQEDSASAEVFGRVLRRAFELAPAERYGLIFFSHASGWMPFGMLQNPTRSIGWDSAGNSAGHTEMELADFAEAIPDGALDFILFEACLMSGIEVAYALRSKADFMLASSAEIVSPGFTPIYPAALHGLLAQRGEVAQNLERFGQAYMSYINQLAEQDRSATLSLIDLREVDALANSTREIIGLYPRSVDLETMQHFDRPGSYGDNPGVARYFDLEEWIETGTSSEKYFTVWERQLKRTVRWDFCTKYFLPSHNGFEILRHSGLTVYLEREELPILNEKYHKTEWWQFINNSQ